MVAGCPGALVWMGISALFGLSTKYAECLLAFKYREKNTNGEMSGGPMYTMKNGFRNKTAGIIFGTLFALFGALASFGIGNLSQANSISGAIKSSFGVPVSVTGIVLTILTLLVVVGGIQSISKVSSVIVPAMAVLYTIFGLIVIIANHAHLLDGLRQIFVMAVDPQAVGGGVIGAITVSVMNSMRYGVSRGVFSNEAGLGSAAIAASASATEDPARQGYISMTGVFFDTLVVCTITGLAIASSGVLGTVGPDGKVLNGVNLTIAAFDAGVGPGGKWLVTIGIILFAFSTIIGWEYQGEKSFEYLVRNNRTAIMAYRIIFSLVVFFGATQSLELVWDISDIMNALMAIPNLISLLVLSGVVAEETMRYEAKRK
jgi:AGCS family alanine or glycine:cation symporter